MKTGERGQGGSLRPDCWLNLPPKAWARTQNPQGFFGCLIAAWLPNSPAKFQLPSASVDLGLRDFSQSKDFNPHLPSLGLGHEPPNPWCCRDAAPRLQAWLPRCYKAGGREFSSRLRAVSALSQRKGGQGWEGHQRVHELRAPQLDVRGLISSELLSWTGKGSPCSS